MFTRLAMPAKAALSEVLTARIELTAGQAARALKASAAAVERLESVQAPAVGWQALLMIGAAHESLGETAAAYAAYQRARGLLEELRSHLPGDELKITFLSDKLAIYDGLVTMALEIGGVDAREETAFGYIEEAKSRSFADLIRFAQRSAGARAGTAERPAPASAKPQELHGYDHRIERETSRPAAPSIGAHRDGCARTPAFARRARRRLRDDAGRRRRARRSPRRRPQVDGAAIRDALPPASHDRSSTFIGGGVIRAWC